jgi:O-antigen/teichoic acid export membrane protein
MGLQRPGLLQAVTATALTLKTVGAAFILWKVSATVTAFFMWQAFVTGMQVTATTAALWWSLPGSRRPRVNMALLMERWRFAAGLSATTALALLLTQLDKILLSKFVSLPLFGFYTLAGTVADALYKVVTPINASFFPQFSILVAKGDRPGLVRTYHRGCQLISVLLLPAALVIIAFSRELVALWTGSAEAAAIAGPVAAVLTVGTALNGLMSLPYALQLAHGWVKLGLLANLTGLMILGPSIVWLVINYGLSGAAFGWVLLNLGYVLIVVPMMHRRLLRGEWRRWLWSDVAQPLLPALAVVAVVRALFPADLRPASQAAVIISVTIASVVSAVLGAPDARGFVRRTLDRGLRPNTI